MTGYESKRAAARDKLAQEPVAHLCGPDENGLFGLPTEDKVCKDCFPVYAAPQQRPWVGLTVGEIEAIGKPYEEKDRSMQAWGLFACAIEARLKEKNG
jgi:hypothetical protein